MSNQEKICVLRYRSANDFHNVKKVLKTIEECGSFDLEMIREGDSNLVWAFYVKPLTDTFDCDHLEKAILNIIYLFGSN